MSRAPFSPITCGPDDSHHALKWRHPSILSFVLLSRTAISLNQNFSLPPNFLTVLGFLRKIFANKKETDSVGTIGLPSYHFKSR
jgi:hypothetical protein